MKRKRFKKLSIIRTPEHDRAGVPAESEWLDSKGIDVTPSNRELRKGVTVVDKAQDFLRMEGVTAKNQNPMDEFGWFIIENAALVFEKGNEKREDILFFPVGFSRDDLNAIGENFKTLKDNDE